jgi:hypothetical protein
METLTGRRIRAKNRAPGRRPESIPLRQLRESRARQRNGGGVSSFAEDYFQPLRPVQVPGDMRRYLDIDSIGEIFGKFATRFDDPARWPRQGHVIVVTGDRGFGKTSLIQRCAHWLRFYQQSKCEVTYLDLSDERWTGEGKDRVKRVFSRMLHHVRDDISAAALSEISGEKLDIADSFKYLSDAMSVRRDDAGKLLLPLVLLVTLPPYPKPSEITQYYNLAQAGMFIFAEVFEEDETHEIIRNMHGYDRSGVDAYALPLSVLKPGDAMRLADWIRIARPGPPELTDRIIRDHLDSLVIKRRISMSELMRLTMGVLD